MKWIYLSLIALSITACGTRELEIVTKPTEIKWTQPADPSPVKLDPPNWRIITEQNAAQVLADLKKENNGMFTIVFLTTQDYQKLMVDLADIKRYIDQQKAIIIYYKNITKN